MYRISMPLAATQFPGDDEKKKKKPVNYKEGDLTPSQRKKLNSVNLSDSARQKAINAFVKVNMKKNK